MVKALPFSQMLRARRIVENESHIKETLTEMEKGFLERGYPNTQFANIGREY